MDLVKKHTGDLIRDQALRLGFDAIGFSRAEELVEDKERFKKWLDKGYNAGMGYMANHFDKRMNPALLVEGSLSVITVLKNYYPSSHSLATSSPKISRYAFGTDYHFVVKDQLSKLFDYIREYIYPELQGRFFVDSAPLLERALAVRAGLGWIGKNSMFINRKLGSFVFIGELVVNLDLPENQDVVNDGCGGCTRCIDACPTAAILPNRQVDASRCISYQTIEHKGDIPESLKGRFEGWIFGCDTCQEVCPWNRKAQSHNEPAFKPSEELLSMTPEKWAALTPERFSTLFKNSALKRTKFEGLTRNLQFVK